MKEAERISAESVHGTEPIYDNRTEARGRVRSWESKEPLGEGQCLCLDLSGDTQRHTYVRSQ